MSEYEFLKLNIEDGIAVITMDHAPLNILHNPMMAEFNAALEEIINRDDLAAIVIDANGKAFCAGVDVGDHSAESAEEMISLFHGIFRKLATTDAVTIAVVQRAALGGGCEIAAFCDIILASDRAKFGQPEVQVGVFPPVAACIFPLQIGIKKAVELNALGETINAEEALRIGLVSHVFPADDFELRVSSFLNNIRKLSRPVVRMAKKATMLSSRGQIMAHLEQAESLYLNDLMKLSDSHEGIKAFIERRAPVWTHA